MANWLRRCHECGFPLGKKDVFCLRCGARQRRDIGPRDGVGAAYFTHYSADYNIGAQNTVHSGSDNASYLLLPIIPAKWPTNRMGLEKAIGRLWRHGGAWQQPTAQV